MLVLRRRPLESILFDGGLKVTLAGVVDQRAWLSLSAPCLSAEVVLSPVQSTASSVCLALRGPRALTEEQDGLHLELGGSADAVVLVNRSIGDVLHTSGLTLSLKAIEAGRAVLRLELACITGEIGVSIFSVTGSEAKIGIEAPREVRVLRDEVWRELEAANAGAGEAWSEADLAALSAARRRP